MNLPPELEKKIIGVIDSKDMREYCVQTAASWTVQMYVELIASALVAMDRKIALLEEVLKVPMASEDLPYVSTCIRTARAAMKRLYEMDGRASVLLVKSYDTEPLDMECMGVEPVSSYDGFLSYIREEFPEADTGEGIEPGHLEDYYFELDLYDTFGEDPQGEEFLINSYRYTCTPNGEVQFFTKNELPGRRGNPGRRSKRQWDEYHWLFSGRNGLNGWRTPFRPGDVLYVDCRPYFKPTYCLVHYLSSEMPWDCCGLRCLYLTYGGMIGEAALKHGRFLIGGGDDFSFEERQYVSPLYRAERFSGTLSGEYAELEAIREQLIKNANLGIKIDRLFFGDKKQARDVTFVRRMVPSKGKAEYEGDRARTIPVVTTEQIRELTGEM